MDTLNKISSFFEKAVNAIIIVLLGVMSVVYFSAVFARFVLNSGIPWAEELTRYANVALVILGCSVAARHKDHINVSALEAAIHDKNKKKVLYVIQQVAFIIYFGFTGVIAVQFAGSVSHISPSLRIPMSFMYGIVAVACLLNAFQAIVYIINLLAGKEEV